MEFIKNVWKPMGILFLFVALLIVKVRWLTEATVAQWIIDSCLVGLALRYYQTFALYVMYGVMVIGKGVGIRRLLK
ncbi:hypothetical protein [Flavobacterium stagni]|uniref:Uncharacterized protein n=1 Tax=Flavobacterium stagni TaxID=2506421 RepID=A0A4Q1K9H5_9FLAO|nr:hypothetical protein [Flavobacterium stagni]RXR22615.1 hypothetical protein EQG61_08520 [Flavobacterium stagni]